jgi:glycerol kinase
MFGAKMKTPLHLEEAAFGAALFAMTATGKFDDVKKIIKYEV